MAVKLYRFEVTHHELGTKIVVSIGPESATMAAARAWGVDWASIAGWCRVTKLGKAQKPRCRNCHREFGEPGDVTAYCPACQKVMDMRAREKRFVRKPDRRAGYRER